MGLLFTAFTAAGPIIGGLGYFAEMPILFWIGVVLAAANLVMNLVSGAMNFPLLPIIFVVGGSLTIGPWYAGAGVGLLVWTALEAAGELLPFKFPWQRL
jgi:hypothetical protein